MQSIQLLLFVAVVALIAPLSWSYPSSGYSGSGECPVLSATRVSNAAQVVPGTVSFTTAEAKAYMDAVTALDWNAVKADIKAMFTNSQEFWPADFNHYGPFMIRQAWHCAGSYRIYDGHGGCDGGRQRFEPERSWDDNTNLDKTKRLLWPIKQKYGSALSWGDLIILTGTTAVEAMGGPSLGFCAGRVDDTDGTDSLLLGSTPEQQAEYPCAVNGDCHSPLGPTTIGLIYVNPEGPMGVPTPAASAPQVRDTFARMAMDDKETVALIGGGHAFGKSHGACPLGPGPNPHDDPLNPWPGKCGSGKGADTFTSGFEGPWTTTPTQWSNQYFHQLLNNDWQVKVGPGGHNQWHSNTTTTAMLTSDISLLHDPEGKYQEIVQLFANNITDFNDAFSRAWYKLTTRDMGPIQRCLGSATPAAQPWQFPLPSPPSSLPDFDAVRSSITTAMTTATPATLDVDTYNGASSYGAIFVQLAWQCASTFRRTDFLGGCNGARIRFSPQLQWPVNVAMDKALELLKPVKEKFGASLSWSDLIVLAAQVAIEAAGGTKTTFCGGRTDDTDGKAWETLQPNYNGTISVRGMRMRQTLVGLTSREFVALQARPRSAKQQARLGFSGTWSVDPRGSLLSNQYFITLLNETWSAENVAAGTQYKAVGKDIYMIPTDLNIKADNEWLGIAQEYASDNALFLREFASAWTKLVTQDRFQGPLGNVCTSNDDSSSSSSSSLAWYIVMIISIAGTLAFSICVYCACFKKSGDTSVNSHDYSRA